MSDPVPSLAIYDATTAGRAIITAADAAAQRTLLSVYSTAQVDGLLSGLGALTSEDIDTLAELNAILTDANFATVATTGSYNDLSDQPTIPAAIASGTITPRADDIDLSGGSIGDVITVQADGSLALSTPAGGAASPLTLTASVATETPLTIQGAASQTANLQEWKDSSGVTQVYVDSAFNVMLKLTGQINWGTSVHSPRMTGGSSGREILFNVGDNRSNIHTIGATGLVVGGQGAGTGPQCGVAGSLNRSRTVLVQGSNSTVDYIATGGVDIKAGVYTGGTNADGADVFIAPSLGIGTGNRGHLILENIPTSDPVVAGAIWNDAGTLKISAG